MYQRAEEKKNIGRFNKRFIFTDKVPDSCYSEMQIELFRQSRHVIIEVISEKCVLILKWFDTSSEITLTNWILLGEKQSYHWQGRELLKESDVGWGYRISGIITLENNNYPYQIFLSKSLRKQYSIY